MIGRTLPKAIWGYSLHSYCGKSVWSYCFTIYLVISLNRTQNMTDTGKIHMMYKCNMSWNPCVRSSSIYCVNLEFMDGFKLCCFFLFVAQKWWSRQGWWRHFLQDSLNWDKLSKNMSVLQTVKNWIFYSCVNAVLEAIISNALVMPLKTVQRSPSGRKLFISTFKGNRKHKWMFFSQITQWLGAGKTVWVRQDNRLVMNWCVGLCW